MRDGEKKTRYFSFALPKGREGVFDERFEANVVTLNEEDIVEYFDAPYHLYVQGACMHNGLIYSTEGFGDKRHPALRIIDPKKTRADPSPRLLRIGTSSRSRVH
jgi:hypothetical protein